MTNEERMEAAFMAVVNKDGIHGTLAITSKPVEDHTEWWLQFTRADGNVAGCAGGGRLTENRTPEALGRIMGDLIVRWYKSYDDPNSNMWTAEHPKPASL